MLKKFGSINALVAAVVIVVFAAIPHKAVAQSNTSLGRVIDVSQAGPGTCAKANGVGTDDSVAFTCKLTAFGVGGGILFVPPGDYLLSQTLNVPANVSLRGSGNASILHQSHSLLAPLVHLIDGSELRDMKLTQDQPAITGATWAPYLDYDYQVWVDGLRVNVINILLLNPTRGILVRSHLYPNPSGSIGQVYLSNIRGQPLFAGIYVDGDLDVSRFEDIHFWPFWTQDARVVNYTLSSGVGIQSYRNDGSFFSNIFLFKYLYGLKFSSSLDPSHTEVTGSTYRAHVSGYMCDFCTNALFVNGDGTTASFDSITMTSSGQPNVYIQGNSVAIAINKLDVSGSQTNVVRVEGNNNSVVVGDSLVRDWNGNTTGQLFPAFSVASGTGSVISVSNTLYNHNNGAALSGGSTVILNQVNLAPGLF